MLQTTRFPDSSVFRLPPPRVLIIAAIAGNMIDLVYENYNVKTTVFPIIPGRKHIYRQHDAFRLRKSGSIGR
jgi:hypothetical protein